MRLRASLLLALLPVCSCRQGAPGQSPAGTDTTLRVLLGVEPTSLDPQLHFDDVSSMVLDNVFESLVRFDGSMAVTSGLALRWINPDDRTWRFFLDPAARFHDGSPVTAADVKFSLERVSSLAGSEIMGFARHIVEASPIDAHTLDVRTDTPIAILNSLAFIPIMSERHVRQAGDAVGERPMGSGPYRFVSWDKGRRLVLEASAHYAKHPAVRRVEFLMARDDEAVLRALESLPLDLAVLLRWSLRDELERRKRPGQRVLSADGLGVFYLMLNVRPEIPGHKGRNPLADPRVRHALALATDREGLAREGLHGAGHPAQQLVVPSIFGYDPAAPGDPHDPETARRLLAESGRKGLSLQLLARRDRDHGVEAALIRQWEQVGVRASLEAVPTEEFQPRLDAGRFDAAVQGFSCTSGDASELLLFALHSKGPHGNGSGNAGAYASPRVDQLTGEYLKVFDPKRRLEMLQAALRVVAEERPLIPLFVSDDLYVVADRIRWQPAVNGVVRVADISFAPAR
jgi:peptide/nickel transport system substrate-binding protein